MTRREKLLAMLAKQPEDAFLHYALAMELVKDGDPDAALASFDAALKLDAGYVAAYYQKANILIFMGRTEDARTTLDAGISAARAKGDAHSEEELRTLLSTIG